MSTGSFLLIFLSALQLITSLHSFPRFLLLQIKSFTFIFCTFIASICKCVHGRSVNKVGGNGSKTTRWLMWSMCPVYDTKCSIHTSRQNGPDCIRIYFYSLEGGMDPAACICHACHKQAGRNVGNSNYNPSWRPNLKQREHCGVDQCPNNVYRHTSITSATQIEGILKEKLSFTHQTTPLCQAHYNKIHMLPWNVIPVMQGPRKGINIPDTVRIQIELTPTSTILAMNL